MEKSDLRYCKYFEEDSTAHPYFNGRCRGAKECERVNCGGDERYCSVDPGRKKKAEETSDVTADVDKSLFKEIGRDIGALFVEALDRSDKSIYVTFWPNGNVTLSIDPFIKEDE